MEKSPLNKLPSELLNDIAAMALRHGDSVIVNGSEKSPNAAAFTQTCKQMRANYNELYYHINTFVFETTSAEIPNDCHALAIAFSLERVRTMGTISPVLTSSTWTGCLESRLEVTDSILKCYRTSQRVNCKAAAFRQSAQQLFPELRLRFKCPDGATFKTFAISLENPSTSLDDAVKGLITEFIQELRRPNGRRFLPMPDGLQYGGTLEMLGKLLELLANVRKIVKKG